MKMDIEKGSTRLHSVENLLWKILQDRLHNEWTQGHCFEINIWRL